MSLKSFLLTGLSGVLVAATAVGGTLAYLMSTDSDVNVMTLGNVKIEQVEYERDVNGDLTEFTQTKPALPAVYDTEAWAMEGVEVNGTEYKVFSEDMKNVIDKIVTVNNTGETEAYVRTIVAIEAPNGDPDDLIHLNYNNKDVITSGNFVTEIDGVDYYIVAFTYKEALAAGKKSAPSLMQLFLDKRTTNEDCALFGGSWDVLVFSQAVQADGFDDADVALDEAFGDITPTNHPWLNGVVVPTIVYNDEDLVDALENGESVVLANDIALDAAKVIDDYANINLNGHELSTVGLELKNGGYIEDGSITSDGNTYLVPHLKISGGKVTMENVNVQVDDYLNGNANWTEATGMEVVNATAILNNCNISIHNDTSAKWVYSYGISLNNAEITMNGGSITATCVAGTAANGPTNPNAISTMGSCTATLNNVNVSATYYGTTVNGHFTLNTTDRSITSSNIVDNRGGSHTINYID